MNTTKHENHGAVAGQVDCRVRPLCWRLGARTNRGANKLRETKAVMPPAWDGVWETVATRAALPFSQGVDGPWHFVRPAGAPELLAERLTRWVHESRDDHFTLTAA